MVLVEQKDFVLYIPSQYPYSFTGFAFGVDIQGKYPSNQSSIASAILLLLWIKVNMVGSLKARLYILSIVCPVVAPAHYEVSPFRLEMMKENFTDL